MHSHTSISLESVPCILPKRCVNSTSGRLWNRVRDSRNLSTELKWSSLKPSLMCRLSVVVVFCSSHTKICHKSPGTPLKASSAHIRPRTFETHETFPHASHRLGFLMLGLVKYCAPPSYSGKKNTNFNLIHANLASQIPASCITHHLK